MAGALLGIAINAYGQEPVPGPMLVPPVPTAPGSDWASLLELLQKLPLPSILFMMFMYARQMFGQGVPVVVTISAETLKALRGRED